MKKVQFQEILKIIIDKVIDPEILNKQNFHFEHTIYLIITITIFSCFHNKFYNPLW